MIWGAEGIGAVAAMRWKTQLNENGKVPAWHSAMSELDHNEVVGWVAPYGARYAVIALRHDGEDPELAARFALSADIARDAGRRGTARCRRAGARRSRACSPSSPSATSRAATWGSAAGIDPTPVEAIDAR